MQTSRTLTTKPAAPHAGTTALEREIGSPREISLGGPAACGFGGRISQGERVYRLYALTAEEIKLVEEGAK
jgi:hypothetical protein